MARPSRIPARKFRRDASTIQPKSPGTGSRNLIWAAFAGVVCFAAEQRLNGVHGGDEPRLIGGLELFERGAGLALGPPLQRCERLAARADSATWLCRVSRAETSAGSVRAFRSSAARGSNSRRRGRARGQSRSRSASGAGDLVQQPRLAERIGAVEVGLAQHAELPRVEAVEAAHGGDCVLALVGVAARSWAQSSRQILD